MNSRGYFEGVYHKLQSDNKTIAFIPGRTDDEAFIQVITNGNSYYISYSIREYIRRGDDIYIENNIFSKEGISINICNKDIVLKGNVKYTSLSPLKRNIMGPFQYIPMECSHGVISMKHELKGNIKVNDLEISFNTGKGYSEQDRGNSFPKNYIWVQSNDFLNDTSIMLSIADIPINKFKGIICAMHHENKEYIFATYKGAKCLRYNERNIIIKQGKYILIVEILEKNGYSLKAPQNGKMNRIIKEAISCKAKFKLYYNNKIVFDYMSNNASFEYVRNTK